MTAWLQEHGFTYKRPKKVPGKLDSQKQEAFIKEYEALKANLKPDEEIYFVDAVHPEHQSQAVCGWIKKGVQKTLQTTGKQLRLHLAGAICLTGMKVVSREYESIDADAMIDFYKNLGNTSSASTIYVILDIPKEPEKSVFRLERKLPRIDDRRLRKLVRINAIRTKLRSSIIGALAKPKSRFFRWFGYRANCKTHFGGQI